MLAGCGGRSDAQKAFLVGQSSSLGRCTLGEGGGDFGAVFDPLQADSWNRLNSEEQAWARVMRWQITSKPKSPPGDVTVMVTARFEILRGSRAVWARNSDSTAASLERANVDPKRVGPAVRRWFSDGDTGALLRALTGSSYSA